MTATSFSSAPPETTLAALSLPLVSDLVPVPSAGRVLFLRARAGSGIREWARPGWVCQQSFLPFADELRRCGLHVGAPAAGEKFPLVLVLPPRQRDEARAVFAQGLQHLKVGGTVLACMPNSAGARSGEADLTRLAGAVQHLSKHKCRVFWAAPDATQIDRTLLDTWAALDAPRTIAGGYVSRPGLFAWDRIDRASALLAEHLPDDLHGRVADLGSGYGYLATQIVAHCPHITALDLYEAEQRALEPARLNLQRALRDAGRQLPVEVLWHDVTGGLPQRYDAIVSNPPFHQGRADMPELGRAFITSAAEALRADGRLLIVANRHLAYETLLQSRFNEVRAVVVRDGFKVIAARGVKPA